jgi:hypothetical protein
MPCIFTRGTTIETRWIPAHIDTEGNEKADKLAKEGSNNTDHKCTASRTTITHLQRVNRARLFHAWGEAVGSQITSWSYPEYFAKWNLRDSLTYFKFFCQRTNFDRYCNSPGIRCRRQTADISALHLVRDYPLLDKFRGTSFRAWGTMPDLELSMVIDDSEVETKLREFVSKADLGCGCMRRWDGKVPSKFTC